MSPGETIAVDEGSWSEPSSKRSLAYRIWRPSALKALVVIVHGFGEHGGRYATLAQALARQGLCVAIPDLWAHGRSGGRRGDIGSVDQVARDCQALTEQCVLPATGQRRYAVFGHSFGGLVAILWALQQPAALDRLVVQSPLLEVGFPIPRWKTAAAWILATCWPSFALSMDLDTAALSRDPIVGQAYRADPLVHNRMSAGAYCSLLRARDEALRRAAELRVPTLVLCGSADRIIAVDVARRWFEQLCCEKRLVMFPEGYHELHQDLVKDEVERTIAAWLLASRADGITP